jgi:zinc protease
MPLLRRVSVAVLTVPAFVLSGWLLSAEQAAPAASAPQAGRQAPTVSATTAALTDKIPTDPSIITGQFPNGLKYYIRKNAKPVNRAELRLVVNAGSVLEGDDQQGLAHFVEHMAFNGTKNFPKLQIVQFMESIGMRFGPSINAFTSFDETVYMLTVPTEKREIIDRAFLVLEDWAQNVSFEPAEIDKERGVILEEWRLRRGAAARLQDKQFPVLLAGSRYATRLPIGKPEIIQNFKHDRLTQFYKDWYKPDLMSVIAVGDFDPAAIEGMIRAHFGAIPRRTGGRQRTPYNVPARTSPAFVVATDREQPTTQVVVVNLMPTRDESTHASYRRSIVEGLFSTMLSARFQEMARKPDAPFLGAGSANGSFVRTAEGTQLGAAVREGGVERGLEALFVEAERVTKFGFTATELTRAKTNALRRMEQAVAEKDNQESADLAAEYSRNYLEGEPIPGIVYEDQLYKRFLPTITLDELNALARTWSPERSRVVMVSAPEKAGLAPPTEAALAKVIAGAAGKATTPYDDGVSNAPLMAKAPAPGTIVNTATREAIGITEWTLSNGIKVILKPTTFKQDEIVFRGFSYGGSSLSSDADYVPASTAAQVVAAGGLASMNSSNLSKALTGVIASAQPSIGNYEESINGGGSPKDLETMMQLIHLRFTEPRQDAEIFGVMRDQTKAALANQAATPAFAFQMALNEALNGNHIRTRPMTPAIVDEMNLDKSMAFYRDRFGDAGDFTFVFVGTFDLNTMRPLVERYLASLPSKGRKETWKDINLPTPSTVVERRVAKGIEPQSQTQIIFKGPFQYDQAHRNAIRAMGIVLSTRLRLALREDLGGTYSINASPSYTKVPKEEYTVTIQFGSSPDRADALATRVFTEIESLKTSGPTDAELNDAKQALKREFETGSTQNAYLLGQIANRYQIGESVEEFFKISDTFDRITAAEVKTAATTYLPKERYVKVVLVPEK